MLLRAVNNSIIESRVNFHTEKKDPSRLGLKNTLTASLQKGKNPSLSVTDITVKHHMIKLQYWKFGKCGVSPQVHCPPIHYDPVYESNRNV